jgi:hypothetical protein
MTTQSSVLKNKVVLFDCQLDTALWLFDLNRDGIQDLVGIGSDHQIKVALSSKSTGTWTQSNELWAPGAPTVGDKGLANTPFFLFNDFNNDGLKDFLVFITGPLSSYGAVLPDGQIAAATSGLSVQMYLGNVDGQFTSSSQISNVYQSLAEANNKINPGYQIDNRISVKDVSFADIDGDGDTDMWIESSGGWNIGSHFLINDGNGQWSVDQFNRIRDI